jgi:hypothetical protein
MVRKGLVMRLRKKWYHWCFENGERRREIKDLLFSVTDSLVHKAWTDGYEQGLKEGQNNERQN